jgi:type I restriction enzyme R subunit
MEVVEMAMFGTIVVVTDRPSSDHWFWEAIRQSARVGAIVDARRGSSAVIAELLHTPNRILLVTSRALSQVMHEIKEHFHGYGYAIVIDESQPWQAPSRSAHPGTDELTQGTSSEEQVNVSVAAHGFPPNASYFVFSASPNERTLELFGQPYYDRGQTRYRPFHQFGVL